MAVVVVAAAVVVVDRIVVRIDQDDFAVLDGQTVVAVVDQIFVLDQFEVVRFCRTDIVVAGEMHIAAVVVVVNCTVVALVALHSIVVAAVVYVRDVVAAVAEVCMVVVVVESVQEY